MKLMFSGCGGAFALSDQFQTNAVVMADDGSRMLLDCGSYAPLALHEQGVMVEHIKALYISHLHADHVGGVEWLALKTYFNPKIERPKLFCDYQLMQDMWDKTLRGGLETLEGKVATLESYFDCHPVHQNKSFMWKDVKFTPVQTIHVLSGYRIMHSFGLIIDAFPDATDDERRELWKQGVITRIFYTTDTQFAPSQLTGFYKNVDLIFHDCETSSFASGVHSTFTELSTLPAEIKKNMQLKHHSLNAESEDVQSSAKDHGFAGFVKKGQVFEFGVVPNG